MFKFYKIQNIQPVKCFFVCPGTIHTAFILETVFFSREHVSSDHPTTAADPRQAPEHGSHKTVDHKTRNSMTCT